LLVIPHLIVLYLFGIVAFFAFVGAWFAVLFTGRWPEGLRRFLIGFLRWQFRVTAYYLLLTDVYPPFDTAP
jgi:hypothetical protein